VPILKKFRYRWSRTHATLIFACRAADLEAVL
jgi:hypothetical protein